MLSRRKECKRAGNSRLVRSFVAIVTVALLIAAIGLGVRAQTTTSASIQGTVTDPSGAAIAGATVTVTNKGTGVTQNTVSDSQGRYQFAQLILGTYDLDATKDGFQKVVKTGIQLSVGTTSVVDMALPVGQSVQTVTVEASNVQVETTTAQVSTLIDSKQLTDLPLNNRSLANLILLAPGVNVYTNAFTQGAFYGGGFTFSVGGGRPNGQAMVLDDSDVQDYYSHGAAGGALGTYMGVDAIGQFQVLTNTYSAQFGGAGSVVNQATKSGTNSFHGSAYEFFRNSALDARSWFDGTEPLLSAKTSLEERWEDRSRRTRCSSSSTTKGCDSSTRRQKFSRCRTRILTTGCCHATSLRPQLRKLPGHEDRQLHHHWSTLA